MDEAAIRADERASVAKSMRETALKLLHDPTSDAVDGYVAAALIDLAKTIATFKPHN